jgi:esterase/lipase superfamily enzyme
MRLVAKIVVMVFMLVAVAGADSLVDKLSAAIQGGDVIKVQELIAQGASLDTPDAEGQTPLLRATESGLTDMVLQLVLAGVSVNGSDAKGTTALMLASQRGYTAIVLALLDAGADPGARDLAGNDALKYALKANDPGNVVGILSSYGACLPEPVAPRGFAQDLKKKFSTIPVYFATNRQVQPGSSGQRVKFTGEPDRKLHYGICTVSIPETHLPGELEAPSLFRIELSEDPKKHIVLQKTEQLGEDEFYRSMKRDAGKREVLIFIHGYNVGFEKAARRTAQIVYDLQFAGVPLLISWPSSGSLLGYQDDAAKIEQSIPAIQSVIAGVIARFKPDRINVIAHSMGTYGLSQALVKLSDASLKKRGKPVFNQLILAAPDIDADLFRKEIAPKLAGLASRVSLYGSSNDLAMSVSRRYNQGRRAGDSAPEIVVAKGIDSIDVSQIDTSLVGHSYYGSNRSVITDIREVLQKIKPENRDFLDRKGAEAKPMQSWYFNPLKKGPVTK